jgi:hypothetical protein
MSEARYARVCIILLLLLLAAPFVSLTAAAAEKPADAPAPAAVPQYGDVTLSLYVINIYNFEYKTGDYTLDFYLKLNWTDSRIDFVNWYVMNGRPSYAGAKELVDMDNKSADRYELWRVREDLSTPMLLNDYPFDHVSLPISVELLNPNFNCSLVWDTTQSGIDPSMAIAGWSINGATYSTSFHQYPLGVAEPQAVMTISITRNTVVAFMNTILPPLVFCVVSAFSFLLRLDDGGSFGLRIGLNTSMIITAVLFNISEVSQVPPMTGFSFYGLFFLAVICFLAGNLLVTMAEYIGWRRGYRAGRMRNINNYGALATLILPAILVVVGIYSLSYG